MKKIELISVYVLISVLICFQVMLFVQNKKIIGFYKSSEVLDFSEETNFISNDFENENKDLETSSSVSFQREIIIEIEDSLKNNLKKLQELKQQNSIFEEKLTTLNETYKSILEEIKKQTVDITAKDSALMRMKTEAEKYYEEKKYSVCAKLCKNILSYESDDLKIRLLKFKSLYYANPTDGSKFDELLNDFNILEKNHFCDKETLLIVEIIKSEKGMNDE